MRELSSGLSGFACSALKNGECQLDPTWGAPCQFCPKHTPEVVRAAAIERAAELRHVAKHRCAHRSVDSVREEPCNCPVIGMLPIYRCTFLEADCADLRRPNAPAHFCADCPHRDPLP